MLKLLYFLFIFISTNNAAILSQTPKKYDKVIVDVDAGADDAFAIQILSLFSKQKTPLLAITCVAGNTNIENVKINILRTLQNIGMPDIPVYIGEHEPFFKNANVSDSFFGQDGFGDFPYDPSTLGKERPENAVVALLRLVNKYPGEITVMAFGPLTNIALAIKTDRSFMKKINKLIIGGGSVSGIGNVRPGIEFNFLNDPEATHIVLAETSYTNTILFPWDTVVEANISKEWRHNVLGKLNNPHIEFLNKAESATINKTVAWHMLDPFMAAVYVWPSIITCSKPLRVSIITGGEGRGGLLVDHYFSNTNVNTSNLNVIMKVDPEIFKEKVYNLFNKAG